MLPAVVNILNITTRWKSAMNLIKEKSNSNCISTGKYKTFYTYFWLNKENIHDFQKEESKHIVYREHDDDCKI